jgi:hypothetical protein
MVIDPLVFVLLEDPEELEHIGDRVVDLVAGAVAANHDVFRHGAPGNIKCPGNS